MPIEIIYQDAFLMVINKPNGLLVHPTKMAMDADTSVLDELEMVELKKYYTVHRLDRKTSGCLIIALDKKTQSDLNRQFREREIAKCYHAIVRGFVELRGTIDYAIKNDKQLIKEAQTDYRLLKHYTIPYNTNGFDNSRYSMVALFPKTGRYHQLRMHLKHIFHPIIGDRPHGCNKQNKFFKNQFGLKNMLLHARSIDFTHPVTQKRIKCLADYPIEFKRIQKILEIKE